MVAYKLFSIDLEADLAGAGFGLDMVSDIAELYEGSIEASAHSVLAVWPEDCLFIVLEPGLKKEQRDDPAAEVKLRVTSVHATGRWPFVPPNKSASEDGPLARAWAGELVDERTTLEGLCTPVPNVDVSARLIPYWRGGERVDRVLALFRRPASSMPTAKGG